MGTDEAQPGLMSVKTDLVREHLVGGIHEAAIEHLGREPDAGGEVTSTALELVLGLERATEAPPETREAAAGLARLGWAAREAERAMLEPAREPGDWLAAEIAQLPDESERAARCALLAASEPASRPHPASEAPTWRVPGPGGHVRHYVAAAAIAHICGADPDSALPNGIESEGELKRLWVFGFLCRCCRELPGVR